MKNWSEGKAFLAAICASGVALAAMFGVASVIRHGESSISIPTFATSAQAAMKQPELTGDAAQGRHLFLKNCAHCHGDDAHGDEGPDLHKLDWTDQQIRKRILDGKKGQMTSFAGKLATNDIQNLIVYLRTLK